MRNKLFDSSQFWVLIGGAVSVIGGIFLGVGVARTPAGHSLWSSGWFIGGIAAIVVGVLCLTWSLILYLAHRHAESHMCPDPDAHKAVSASPSSSPWPAQPVLIIEPHGNLDAIATKATAQIVPQEGGPTTEPPSELLGRPSDEQPPETTTRQS